MMENEISVTNSQMVIKKITDDYLSENLKFLNLKIFNSIKFFKNSFKIKKI